MWFTGIFKTKYIFLTPLRFKNKGNKFHRRGVTCSKIKEMAKLGKKATTSESLARFLIQTLRVDSIGAAMDPPEKQTIFSSLSYEQSGYVTQFRQKSVNRGCQVELWRSSLKGGSASLCPSLLLTWDMVVMLECCLPSCANETTRTC